MSRIRASVVVFAAIGISNLCAYGFHLISARTLGPASYGDVAALAALVSIVSLPLGGVQVFVGRHVASEVAVGRHLDDGAYVSNFTAAMLLLGGGLGLLLIAVSPLLKSGLGIASLPAVVLAAASAAPAVAAPALVGAAQGVQRFVLLGIALAVPAAARLLLAAAALAAGFGVAGTMAASLAAGILAVTLPLFALRRSLEPLRTWRPRLTRPDALALLPVVAGTLAITCLTTADLVAAKVVFSPHEAGLYGAASLIGRVILYLPFAIVTVLLPQVAARSSAGRETSEILRTSLLATGAFCVACTVLYAALPHLIVRIAFGSKYDGSSSLLWMFGITMTLYSLLNVLLIYRLARHETAISWLLLGGVVLQIVLFASFHGSAHELLAVDMATAALLLVLAASMSRVPWLLGRTAAARES